MLFSEGIRQDNRLVRCDNLDLKMSFSNIDYALSGYDIVRGYPLTTARDPGFRKPIFKADYVNGVPNGDCRYMLPKGINAVPDISCDVSFKSDIIKTAAEFHQALSTSAHVEGGGWGFQFSASASYQKSSSDMSSKEFVYVISRAQCTSYFSRMDFSNPPTFHEGFIKAVKKLKAENYKSKEISKFISIYGTHFVDEMTFGSTYTKQHRVKQATFKTLSNSKFGVAAQASYSGLFFSGGGGFSLDSEQSAAASNFAKSVETNTVTVGSAPPSNGDAMTWASVVKENPVPIKYSLKPIADLFTADFMTGVPGVEETVYNKIRKKLKDAPKNSCNYLLSKGKSLSCDGSRNWQISEVITIKGGYPFKLHINKQYIDLGTHKSCDIMCSNDRNCVGFVQSAPTICFLVNDITTSFYQWELQQGSTLFKLFRNKMENDLILKKKVPQITDASNNKLYAYKVRFMLEKTIPVAVRECRDISVSDAVCKAFLIKYGSCSNQVCTNRDCYLYHDITNLPAGSEEQSITKEFHFLAN